ncbi:MAG: CHAT domain-containing protein [Rhodospirillales bacterium]|nr:CHAT domain-containing protein [Rhodospirillales bacterium]
MTLQRWTFRLAVLFALGPAAALAQSGGRPVGKNLTGEDCVLAEGGARTGIFCGGVATPAADVSALEQRKDPKDLLEDQGALRALAPGLTCSGPVRSLPLSSGGEGAVRSCAGGDGWPRFVLAARRDRAMVFASGHMTALDLAQRVAVEKLGAAPPPEPTDMRRRIAELEQSVGSSLGLIGMLDIGKVDKLRDLANGYNSLRDYSRAEDAWRQILDAQERAMGAQNPALGDTLAHLALNVANQSRFEEADRLFQRAEPLTRRSSDPDHYPRLLVYRGFQQELQGRYPQALDLVAQSTKIRRERREARDALAHSLYAEAALAMKTGDLARADRTVQEARLNFGAAYGSQHWWVAEAIELQAEVAKRAGRFDDARRLNTQLIGLREAIFGPSRPLARAFAQAAEIEQAAGRPDTALAAWRRMSSTVIGDRRARADADTNDFAGYVLAALRQGRAVPAQEQALADEAFRAAQAPRGGATAQAIAQMSLRLAATTPELSQLARDLQDAYQRMDQAREDLAHEMSKSIDTRSAVAEGNLKRRIVEDSAAIEKLDQRLKREFPAYAALQSPEPASVATVAKLLAPGEALVSMMTSDQGTIVFLLRDGKVKAHAVALSRKALDTVVRELRNGIDFSKGEAQFDLELSHKLYRALLQPLEAELAGVRQLILVPAGAMLALPPAMLVTEPPRQGDYAGASWLIRKHALGIIPSIEAFRALRGAAKARPAPQPFIGFGAPSFSGKPGDLAARLELGVTCRDKGESVARLLRLLEPLPETATELSAMARTLKASASSVVLGDAATETRVQATKLQDYRVIAFATHGLLPSDLPCDIEPALALTPPAQATEKENGLLDASEIANLKLNAEFVILSACNSAAPDGRLGGESLSGLTRAFFYAGARSLYAASFPVPSEQTTTLTTGIFSELAADSKLTRAEAARRSQMKLLAQRSNAHPVFWAGFVLIGD